MGSMESLKCCKVEAEKALACPPPEEFLANEIKAIIKVAMANSIQLQLVLPKPSPPPGTQKLIFDFSVHPYYPVLKIKTN